MKKLTFIFVVVFFANKIVFAEDIVCPRQIKLPPKEYCLGLPAEEGGELCTGDPMQADRGKFIEQYGAAEFKCETERFQEKVLDEIHHDNVSNPEFLSVEGVKQLRIHHQCLQDICNDVILECLKVPNVDNREMEEQLDWCRLQAEKLLEVQKMKIDFIVTGNQGRKERSLLEEKFNAIRERFMNHIHERMNHLLTHIKRFESKVNKLIKYPKR